MASGVPARQGAVLFRSRVRAGITSNTNYTHFESLQEQLSASLLEKARRVFSLCITVSMTPAHSSGASTQRSLHCTRYWKSAWTRPGVCVAEGDLHMVEVDGGWIQYLHQFRSWEIEWLISTILMKTCKNMLYPLWVGSATWRNSMEVQLLELQATTARSLVRETKIPQGARCGQKLNKYKII